MKFKTVFVFFTVLSIGFGVGIVSKLFLVAMNFLIHLIWYMAPQALTFLLFIRLSSNLSMEYLLVYHKNTSVPFPRHYTKRRLNLSGKIFPAILASATIGFTFVSIFPYTPGLIVGIIVAASITVILQKPLLTASILWPFATPHFQCLYRQM